MNRVKINELRAKGVKKDYSVRFQNGLNIIAGEMSTGKTSIFELIDFCLGSREYPKYPEIARNVVAVLLEIQIGADIFTIQRQLFSNKSKAIIHYGSISSLQSNTRSIEVNSSQTPNEVSISSFILTKIGLNNIKLKESPSKESTSTDIMSLRDLLWFCYVQRTRVAGGKLLFENEYMKHIKLRQVADVIFDLHSNVLAALGAELDSTQQDIEEKEKEEKILLKFIDTQGIRSTEELEADRLKILSDIESKKATLNSINMTMSGSSDIARALQEELLTLRSNLQKVRTDRRDQEKTLQRLVPLRAQYYEDISKLKMIEESRQIINPLALIICPVCLSPINLTQDKAKPCALCGNQIKDATVPISVIREIRSTERKLKELAVYVNELDENIKKDKLDEASIVRDMAEKSTTLDETLRAFVSPYVTEIEGLVSQISVHENELKHLEDHIKIRNTITVLSQEINGLQTREHDIIKRINEERTKSTNRSELVAALSRTYYEQLKSVHFPKVYNEKDGFIDKDYTPYVRGLRYDELSSEGAINLSSLCWLTTIFEEAILHNANHPGFLLYDSVQAGIGIGQITEEFRDENIIDGIYCLLERLSKLDSDCQVIIIDNHPPPPVKGYVRARFTGDAHDGTYGFIDNETS